MCCIGRAPWLILSPHILLLLFAVIYLKSAVSVLMMMICIFLRFVNILVITLSHKISPFSISFFLYNSMDLVHVWLVYSLLQLFFMYIMLGFWVQIQSVRMQLIHYPGWFVGGGVISCSRTSWSKYSWVLWQLAWLVCQANVLLSRGHTCSWEQLTEKVIIFESFGMEFRGDA